MNFYQLPVVADTTTQAAFINGGAFKIAWYGPFDLYVATDNGTVYAARVVNDIYFVCIGSGYHGYYALHDNGFAPVQRTVQSTDYNTIYAVSGVTAQSFSWSIDLTRFENVSDMLAMFYDTYVDTSSPNGIVVRVLAVDSDTNDQGGTAEDAPVGGGTEEDGYFDDTSDEVPPSVKPTISGTDSGLVTLFRPTLEQLNQLGAYLWTNIDDFIENLNKLFMNPMDYMIALNIFPVTPTVGTAREIKIGSFSTSISMAPVISQWYEYNCGFIQLHEYWGSYLDYAPYTKIHAMLPFIGSVTLNTDEVMGKMLGLTYRIDLLSGMCVALVTNDNDVYYQFTGECAVAVPLTGSDWSRVYSAAIGAIGTAISGGIATGAAGAVAGGATASLAQARAAESLSSAVNAFSNIPTGVKGVQAMRQHAEEAAQMALNAGNSAAASQARRSGALAASRLANTVAGTVGQVMGAKAHIQHSGTISGSAAMMGMREPYVIIEYPNQSLPTDYKHFVGYPSNIKARLGDLSGYTECEQVIVSGLTQATDGEIAELTEALKGGVYL